MSSIFGRITGRSSREIDDLPLSEVMKRVEKNSGVLSFRSSWRPADVKNLVILEELGYGAYGQVTKRKYKEIIMAVKAMTRSHEEEQMFRVLMDLSVIYKSIDCPEIVKCYGYFITPVEVLLCMEHMETCLEKRLKSTGRKPFEEDEIGKIAVNVLKALYYLKVTHKIIHRDVKPSNILINSNGFAKLCDFGISQKLVKSVVHSNQGCKPYMAPERLSKPSEPYGIRSDVWSLGITIVELATGKYPYEGSNLCSLMMAIMMQDPPRLQQEDGFSADFCDFVEKCLQKKAEDRPNYDELLQHPFILSHQ